MFIGKSKYRKSSKLFLCQPDIECRVGCNRNIMFNISLSHSTGKYELFS